MKPHTSFRPGRISIALCLLGGSATAFLWARSNRSADEARAGIERLHELDVKATMSGRADDLAQLWDADAVRIFPGGPAEIGKAAIYAGDKREEANGFVGRSQCYRPEIRDLQIASDWAFEWGYFSYKNKGDAKAIRGKVLRVIKRQPDDSWKFTRVIGFIDNQDAAVPLAHPCE